MEINSSKNQTKNTNYNNAMKRNMYGLVMKKQCILEDN